MAIGSCFLIWSAVPASADGPSPSPYQPILCSLLESLEAGDLKEVEVSGVYLVGPESQLLYDPATPLCDQDVQPTLWVDFDPAVNLSVGDFDGTSPTGVTFRGLLEGPRVTKPDRLDIPAWIAYVERANGRRHGHLGAFRARLVVLEIVDTWPIRDVGRLTYRIFRPSIGTRSGVQNLALPSYPENARLADISGEVRLRVTVAEGKSTCVEQLSGDRILVASAKTTVESWSFDPEYSGTFTTTFDYRLEPRRLSEDQAPRVMMQLPTLVEITAPRYRW